MLTAVGIQGLQLKPVSIGVLSLLGSSLDAVVSILNKYGGSLWLADPQYVFTGSDGTGIASDGSAVGYVRDVSDLLLPVGQLPTVPVTQAVATTKPLLQFASGRWGLKFDGINDALLTTTLPVVTAETFGVVYTAPATTGSAQFPISRRSTATSIGATIYLNGTNNTVNFLCGAGAAVTGAAVATGNTGVASVVGKVGSLAVRVNGVDGTAVTYATYVCGNSALALGNSVDSQRAFGGTIHAAYYAPVEISSTDRQLLDRLLGKLFGVTVA